uniref:Uncharacterized protein n=1 Tax=Anguilla anguilla TaxID=7936 RepID=A0A0E9WAH1_ANGAN
MKGMAWRWLASRTGASPCLKTTTWVSPTSVRKTLSQRPISSGVGAVCGREAETLVWHIDNIPKYLRRTSIVRWLTTG